MDKIKMRDYLETIPKPEPKESDGQDNFKIFFMTAKKSSRIGLFLIGFPSLLLSLFIFQNLFHIRLGFMRWLGEDSFLPSPLKAVLVFIFLVGFPMIAIVLNLLSLSHFQFDRVRKEFRIAFRIRWWNIAIVMGGGALASFYILHILADSLLGGR